MAIEEIASEEAVRKMAGAAGDNWYGNPKLDDNLAFDPSRQADVNFIKSTIEGPNPDGTKIPNFAEDFSKFSTEFSRFSNEFAKANEIRTSKWESPDFISKVKEQMQRVTTLIQDLQRKPDIGQGDLLRIQYEVTQMALVLDVSSKVGDKSSQALQSLFRNQ